MNSTKQDLRKHLIQVRDNIPAEVKIAADNSIYQKLITNYTVIKAETICCYVSYSKEVNTHAFIDWCLSQHKRVCIPKVEGQVLQLHLITSLDNCTAGFKGILEPLDSSPIIKTEEVDVFVLLGLGFDAEGYRLGYGKGYTDRLLAPIHGYTIGICYTDQLLYALPHEDHDIPVNEVVTEDVLLQF